MRKLTPADIQQVKDSIPTWIKKYGLEKTTRVLRKLVGEKIMTELASELKADLKFSKRKFAVHTAKARKDYPEFDVKKGDQHWYWLFGGKMYRSKTIPDGAVCYNNADILARELTPGATVGPAVAVRGSVELTSSSIE